MDAVDLRRNLPCEDTWTCASSACRSFPERARPGPHLHHRRLRQALGGAHGDRLRPGPLLELRGHRFGDEARAARVQVAVAAARLLRDVEALRDDEMQLLPGPRHGDVEQPAFLLDL